MKISDSEESSDDEWMDTGDADGVNWTDELMVNYIGDLFEMCNEQYNAKKLSVLLYMTLRHFNICWADAEKFMRRIGGIYCKTAQKWANIFLTGDFEEFNKEQRGGKRGDSFYDVYSEIEADAKAYAAIECSKKSGEFLAERLAKFIDTKHYDLSGEIKKKLRKIMY